MEEWSEKIASAADSPPSREKILAYMDLLVRRGYLVETPPPFSLSGKVGPTRRFVKTLEKAFALLPSDLTEEEKVPALSLVFSLLSLGEEAPIEPEKVDPTEVEELAKEVQALLLTLEAEARKGGNPSPPPFHLPPLSRPGTLLRKTEGARGPPLLDLHSADEAQPQAERLHVQEPALPRLLEARERSHPPGHGGGLGPRVLVGL